MQTVERTEPRQAPRRKDVADAWSYRAEAAELRRRAAGADNEQVRRNLLDIAEQYEQLAHAIDRASWRMI